MPVQNDNPSTALTEILNTISHGSSFFLATVGFILLLIKGGSHHLLLEIFSYFIYSLSIIFIFLFSTLFHNTKQFKDSDALNIFNRSSIYLLLSGTATPFTLITIQGIQGISLFVIIWILAIIGIVIKAYSKQITHKNIIEIFLYTLIVLSYLSMIGMLHSRLHHFGIYLVLLGGFIYGSSAMAYRLKFNNCQAIGQSLSLLASIFIWFAIYLYV
ncbi:PAQR family membrane homeostasis protein TrhA [Streptococcus sp. DD10]|uniref:PAQR family membrane homeostasis protein TrhA n=1 Tax=Streptococcus sp. DD10 TaxID=1777878 RepID=UPI00082D2577|nr:hemolysin III family protein [Streptococcus sp. DD10]